MNRLAPVLKKLLPARLDVHPTEQLRAACGALLGILITGLLAHAFLDSEAGWLIAPMGASAVLLFALPASPLAQPWSMVAGNLVSAAVGVSWALWLGQGPWTAGLAVGSAVLAMMALRCLHPPGGAIALSAVLGGAGVQALGYHFVFAPVGLNSLLLLAVALLFNNATRRPYPHRLAPAAASHHTSDPAPNERLGFSRADLDAVLHRYGQVLDVDREDLGSLLRQAEMEAYRRRFGEITCGDIMSRDLVTAEYGTPLEEAWHLLRRHRIKALPVLDRARRVIGILTLVDFMKHAQLDRHDGWDRKLRDFIRASGLMHSHKPEVAGQIMTTGVHSATTDTHIVELVPLLSDLGLHHIPVVDHERRLAGMVTQSDLVAALYRGRLDEVGVRQAA